jgi:hypothetical protein
VPLGGPGDLAVLNRTFTQSLAAPHQTIWRPIRSLTALVDKA